MGEHFYHLIHFRAVTASSLISNQIFEVSLCLLYSVMWDCLITRANSLIDFSMQEIMQYFAVQIPLKHQSWVHFGNAVLENACKNPLTWTLKCGSWLVSSLFHCKNLISGDMVAVSVSFPVQSNQCDHKMWLGHLGLDLHFHYWVQIS